VAAHAGLAWQYNESGQYQLAIESAKKALRIDPCCADAADAYDNLGLAYERLERYEEAVEAFQCAIRTDPTLAAAYNNLAFLYAACPEPSLRDGKKAVELGQHACELTEFRRHECLDTLAAAYAETGDFGKATEFQKKAIELVQDGQTEREYQKRLKTYQGGKTLRGPS
jgi:tetratricopeptide (TPR) repeat protein